MPTTELEIATQIPVHLVVEADAADDMTVNVLSEELLAVALITETARLLSEGMSPSRVVGAASRTAMHVRLARVRYGSPLEVVVVISQAVVASAPAVALIAYGIKRLYGFDLELRAHRLRRQVALEEVQRLIERAESESTVHADADASGRLAQVLAALRNEIARRFPASHALQRSGKARLDDEVEPR